MATSSASCAVMRLKIASAVRPGVSAVHASATSNRRPGASSGTGARATSGRSSTSDTRGPWRVVRTSISTSSPPATSMVSVRTSRESVQEDMVLPGAHSV